MSLEEYLRTTFDGADCEFLDGEILERIPTVPPFLADEKRALVYSKTNPGGELSDILRTENPSIAIPLDDLFGQPSGVQP